MQIGAASNGPLMDTPYTPYDDLPEKLQLEMQRLQHYKDRVNKQALWVVDVALSEWRKAEKKVAVQAAAQSLEEQSAQDRAQPPFADGKKSAPPKKAGSGTPSSLRASITQGNLSPLQESGRIRRR